MFTNIKVSLCIAGFGLFFTFLTFLEKRDQRRKRKNESRDSKDQANQYLESQRVKHPTDEEHRSAEQAHWYWQRESEKGKDRITLATFWVAVVAILVASLAFWQSLRQANIAQTSLEVSDRPWLKVNILETRDIFRESNGFLQMPVKLNVHNFGRSPATNLQPRSELLPAGDEASHFNLLGEEQRVCADKKTDRAYGPIAFQGIDTEVPAFPHTSANPESISPISHAFSQFTLIICVVYNYGELQGHTIFVTAIAPKNGKAFYANAVDIPISEFELVSMEEIQEYAD